MRLVHNEVEYFAHSINKESNGYSGFREDGTTAFVLRTKDECLVYDENNKKVVFVTDKERINELEQLLNLMITGAI